ncbi:MAG: LCP family protein [Candidatus Saccharimonadales bacterium]
MTSRTPHSAPNPRSIKPRPGQDIVVAKEQAEKFPGIGITLSGYNSGGARNSARSVNVVSSRWDRFKKKVTLKRTILLILGIILLSGIWYGSRIIYDIHKLFGGNLFGIFSTTKLKGEDTGRVNILVAGNSADDVGHGGANLTDSIMIVSINTKDNTGFLLSIPRDLYVQTVNNGWQKINDAYVDGQTNNFSAPGYPNGGMGELEQILSQKLGITFNYYALINYGAIKGAVDAVGGIDITIKSSDPRGLYDPSIDYAGHTILVKLPNGPVHLNGEQALDLARARGDAYGSYGFPGADFDRTQHQRDMLIALKNKADNVSVFANPQKLSNLISAFSSNVKTDFKINEVRRLYDLSKLIPQSRIQSIGLTNAHGKDLLKSYLGAGGQDALIPALGLDDYSDIQAFINQEFSNNPLVKEDANIVLLNGTNTYGLANKVKGKLVNNNMHISQIGNANTYSQAVTQIIDLSGGKKPVTRAAIAKQFGSNFTTTNPYAGIYNADFIIVLGNDQVPKTSQ